MALSRLPSHICLFFLSPPPPPHIGIVSIMAQFNRMTIFVTTGQYEQNYSPPVRGLVGLRKKSQHFSCEILSCIVQQQKKTANFKPMK